MLTSGLVIDVHDDVDGNVIRSFYPSHQDIPEVIKEAHALTSEEFQQLPDDDFALILVDGEQKMRKFACIDEGNTRLALLYFEANAHKLPEEAQKVAAANLAIACDWYGIDKAAGLLTAANKAMSLASVPATVKGMSSQIGQNMNGIRAHESVGNSVVTPHQMKMAEVTGTSLMPTQPPGDRSVTPSKTTVVKVAKRTDDERTRLSNNENVTKHEQPKSLTQAKMMTPHVAVTSTAPTKLKEKKASRYALNDTYALDTYQQVKQASAYFDEYRKRMDFEDRHNYCVSLVKRASELNIPVSDIVRKYGSESYASDAEIKVAFDIRRNALVDEASKLILDEIQEKKAELHPDLFCELLSEFDKVAGLQHEYDRYVPDPYYSTYGEKEAHEEYSFINGNDMVTEKDLIRFGKTMHKSLDSTFGSDFANEFRKDPLSIFKSLPLTQKKMIMHLAMDNAPGAEIIP